MTGIWGLNEGGSTYAVAGWLFLRLLGVIYFFAFLALALQIQGLAGSRGILPAKEFLAQKRCGRKRPRLRFPTIFWWNCSDTVLQSASWAGVILAVFLTVGIATPFALILLWILYLSFFQVVRIFLSYQWDLLLLETGFLAIFAGPISFVPQWPPTHDAPFLIRWLLWWLLFRLMFSSGLVKLRSSDPAWIRFKALSYHYETQPLPTVIAWLAHQLPAAVHVISTGIVLIIELATPFLIMAHPPLRHLAALLFVLLMVGIELTGNYCFFNLLGIALSLLLLEDTFWLGILSCVWPGLQLHASPPVTVLNACSIPVAMMVLILSAPPMLRLLRVEVTWPRPLARFFLLLESFRLVNSYGLFSVMTTERPEILIEGSHDGVEWRAYEFKWKPGDVRRRPGFVAPYQPRLDWQMWFAALDYYPNHPWFRRLLIRLLEGSSPVQLLLRSSPFPDSPPRFIRGTLYQYWFTTSEQRKSRGAWWRRERRGAYSPVLSRDQPD